MTSSPTSAEAAASESKLQRLGIECISPGLSSENMDNKMLSTIRRSKTIAREQRQHIEKLGEAQHTLARPRGKSLRRTRVPSPLNIGAGGGGPAGVASAPANITHFRQAARPRVQYVGRRRRPGASPLVPCYDPYVAYAQPPYMVVPVPPVYPRMALRPARDERADDDDDDDADDDAAHAPGERVRGEITLLDDTFAFEFAPTRDQIDKKMFMSICDKVWDEAKKIKS
ncbi:AGL258Cp [Eremothecium gossypii ATCC 10895]|uniref:AGL258Cp n=1 Tax=Eremothecium gossypii (strain ATCC 10895 / CBS 109.51 / FGSC 9923 / NRRL Y-1056) TaxID=284811 RepID=Q751G4_EREGS|nr:AGL258Cp [Eremothecium gossypii ATCC 10895]AAS54233.1 AGL258Cp [Eremothecium gossypii ATCC 10895]AEY98559.1 FAGL258Cp [Eremothecium gossypii FDAG1]